MKALRTYQADAIAKLRQSLVSGKKRPVLQIATGGGKTLVAAAIVNMALEKNKRVIFTVPAISLIDQTVSAFWEQGIDDIGVMQSNHPMTNYDAMVQVCSIQTLIRRFPPSANLVIIDECHVGFDFIDKWKAEWATVPFIGLSATPWARGMSKKWDDLIVAATMKDLTAAGYLTNLRIFAPSHPDLSGVKTIAGDYHEGQLADAMEKNGLTADIVTTWLKSGENRQTICFAVNRVHASHLQTEFAKYGIKSGYVDANTEAPERALLAEKFKGGEVKVVCNVGVLTTGIDWDVRCIIMARPTKSEMLFVQCIGRGTRLADGKSDCIVLDHADNCLRLGFPDDIHHSALYGGKKDKVAGEKKEKEEPLPKECLSCKFLKPAKVYKCPNCGFEPEKKCDIEVEDGELSEVKGKKTHTMEFKENFYREVLWYALMNNKNEKMAVALYKKRFGVFPKGINRASKPATEETLNYIKSSQIAYAKRTVKHG